MQPTIGRIVHYRLDDNDVDEISRDLPNPEIRNPVAAGETYPAVIVAVFTGGSEGPACNLQVLLDGACAYWATSRTEGGDPGHWFWPPRV